MQRAFQTQTWRAKAAAPRAGEEHRAPDQLAIINPARVAPFVGELCDSVIVTALAFSISDLDLTVIERLNSVRYDF